ncbi:regulatory LuxR family protein [Palleronia aestuarii]|uniref:Regulatory LuxR family protein n=1 Tax=Palleronia aestuarii TaxID=568105 RepID=A0A2W7NEM2_9RHOB|nr:autoinducer binding domain-containing protein [Palleronia aestuarii]PZX18370.1 regulatory LuxR family protein [Palleronia aestuarii]
MKQQVLEGFIERIDGASSLGDLEREVSEIRDRLSAQHVLYHWINSEGRVFGAGTYDPAWRVHYLDERYMRIDPVVQGARKRFHPLNWRNLDWSSKDVRDFRADAQDAGIGPQGLTIPIRGPGGQMAHLTATMGCSDAEFASFNEANGRYLILLGHFFNQKALELSEIRNDDKDVALSPREVDALTFLALGYTRSQAADTLSISEHTLRVYIESARHKLSAMNTTHAVAKALNLGLLVI